MRRRTTYPSSGFSLIEMTLVVAIMAIFAAIAAPRYGHATGRYRLDLAARQVAADLRMAQSAAKAASASRSVAFTVATDCYFLSGIPSLDGRVEGYTVCLADEPFKADLTAANFNETGTVTFSGWGLPNYGGSVILAVGSQQKTIVVNGETGQVRIE